MQISKFPIIICALALGTTMSLRADDNPAQAAARAALAAKLFELSDQSATNAPAAAPTPAPATPAPEAPAPAPTMPAAPVVVTPTPAATPMVTNDATADAAAQAAAQET